MQELMKQQQDQMKSILTPEQIQKMESARKERTRKNIE
jgi:Spy/CpxP family protein refolding chaperone